MRKRIWIVPLLCLMAACSSTGCSSTAYQHGLDVSLTALNQASNSFVAFDKDKQMQLVEESTTKEEAKAKLAAYRAVRTPVLAAFLAAYGAIAVAAVKPDEASITEAGKAVLLVYTQLKALFPGKETP